MIAAKIFVYCWGAMIAFFFIYGLKGVIKEKLAASHEKRIRAYIISNSSLLKELKQINSKYCFVELKEKYEYTYNCKSKAEYDRFDFYNAFCNICYQNSKELREINKQALDNSRSCLSYEKEVLALLQQINDRGLGQEYKDDEIKIIRENKIKTYTSPLIVIKKRYTSQKGMNHYHASKEYPLYEIEKAIKEKRDYYKANAERKASVEYERSLMTPKLRYRVMQRDGFKCVICGASSKDGATLHVDHIKPVSKGGKTEMNNLRTLCDRCNLGKGALYIEDGVN